MHSKYWQGSDPAINFFTAVPFGAERGATAHWIHSDQLVLQYRTIFYFYLFIPFNSLFFFKSVWRARGQQGAVAAVATWL